MGRSIITALLILTVMPRAESQTERDLASKLISLEHVGRMRATELKDLKALNAVLHDNFVAVDDEGKLFNKTDLLQFVQAASWLRYRSEDMTVRMHGSTAIITGSYQLEGLIAGKAFVRHGRFVDTWLLDGGKWVAIASVSTPLL
jgi:hypothetical protein